MSSRIAAVKETEMSTYINQLFSGGITTVVDNGGGFYNLTITFTEDNFFHATDLPTLRVGDRITVYDTLTYDSTATQVFFQPRISAIVSDFVITVESTTAPLDTYSWRLLAPHTQAEKPSAFTELKKANEDKSQYPISVVTILNSESLAKDIFNTCNDRFMCRMDFLESVVNRLTDTQQDATTYWTPTAAQAAKNACDYWSLIVSQNMKIQQIGNAPTAFTMPRYRFGTIGANIEVRGASKFFKINWNHLETY